MSKTIPLIILTIIVFYGCDPSQTGNSSSQAYVPVYASSAEQFNATVESSKPTDNPGKIYAAGDYIYQNDQNEGIHVIDNSSPGHPVKVAFIKIPYNTELSVKGDYLYCNCVNDLLTIDIHDPLHPVLTNRLKDAFPLINQDYPPFTGVYFECPDKSKGIVVEWKLQSIDNPKCRR